MTRHVHERLALARTFGSGPAVLAACGETAADRAQSAPSGPRYSDVYVAGGQLGLVDGNRTYLP